MLKSLTLTAVAATLFAAPAFAGDVNVVINGVQARGGDLLAALQTQDQFMQPAGAYGERIQNPRAGAAHVTLHDVAPGDYSLSVLHDADGDLNMKMGPDGRPAEGWAMVNGETLRARPTFDQVKFTVPASGDVDLTVTMQYPAN